MELHNKQKQFIESDKRFKLLNWGRRTGKTTAIAYEILTCLWNKEGTVSYYAPTFSDARDIGWVIFKEVLEPITVSTNESLLEITVKNSKGTTSKLKLTGWEAVKNRDKGRGVENQMVVLDECAFYPAFKEKFSKVIEPTLLTSKGSLVIASTPNGYNHFWEMSKQAEQSDDWLYIHATSYDNPFNDPKELERLKKEKSEDSFAQEYLADFRKLEGLVYKEFDINRHVLKDVPQDLFEPNAGLDFGYRVPTGIVIVKRDSEGRYFVTQEWYRTEKTNAEVIEYAKTLDAIAWYPDPAEPDRIEEMRRAGMNVKEVNKDVSKGIDAVRNLFKNNRLFILADCENLIWELQNYRYHDGTEKVIKENDHLVDALRYVLFMINGISVRRNTQFQQNRTITSTL